ncbi:MAG: hypothetical protein ACLVIY_04015 [Anaerobutyricum soehngenii]
MAKKVKKIKRLTDQMRGRADIGICRYHLPLFSFWTGEGLRYCDSKQRAENFMRQQVLRQQKHDSYGSAV